MEGRGKDLSYCFEVGNEQYSKTQSKKTFSHVTFVLGLRINHSDAVLQAKLIKKKHVVRSGETFF